VEEEKRPGQYFPLAEDGRGTYVFNSKDLCMIEHIPRMIEAGITSLKIEGRMKGINYLSSAVKVYREAIDAYFEDPENYEVKDYWLDELASINYRGYCTGFYLGFPGESHQNYERSGYQGGHVFLGKIIPKECKALLCPSPTAKECKASPCPSPTAKECKALLCPSPTAKECKASPCSSPTKMRTGKGSQSRTLHSCEDAQSRALHSCEVLVEVRNKISEGEEVEVVVRKGPPRKDRILEIRDEDGFLLPFAKPNTHVTIRFQGEHSPNDIIRRVHFS
jgi:hypothetical protein